MGKHPQTNWLGGVLLPPHPRAAQFISILSFDTRASRIRILQPKSSCKRLSTRVAILSASVIPSTRALQYLAQLAHHVAAMEAQPTPCCETQSCRAST